MWWLNVVINKIMNQQELMKQFLQWQETTRRCQRNWDHSKPITKDVVEFLTKVATLSPSKQNDRHYGVCVVTNKDILAKIQDDFTWGIHARIQGDRAMRNSQMHSPLAFVYGFIKREDWYEDWIPSAKGDIDKESFNNVDNLEEEWQESNFRDCFSSINLSAGQIAIAAAMIGLKTGYSFNLRYNAKTDKDWQDILQIDDPSFSPKLYVGVGYPNEKLPWHVSEDLEMLVSDPKDDPTKSGLLKVASNNRKSVIDNTIQSNSKLSETGWGWWRNKKNEIVGMSHAHRSWDKDKNQPKDTSQILWERH